MFQKKPSSKLNHYKIIINTRSRVIIVYRCSNSKITSIINFQIISKLIQWRINKKTKCSQLTNRLHLLINKKNLLYSRSPIITIKNQISFNKIFLSNQFQTTINISLFRNSKFLNNHYLNNLASKILLRIPFLFNILLNKRRKILGILHIILHLII